MIGPYYKYGYFGQDFSLVLAVLIGIGFGFFLERGGLGNAKKLAGQFYLKDFTVIKVMFTAIITAMLGLNILDAIGFLDLNQVYLNPTYLIPQLVAGLLFGVGFVMGGLCPGTCLVAASTGKLDGLVTLAGIFFGIFIFGELFDNFTGFLYSSYYEQITIAQLISLPQTTVVIVFIIVAILIFVIIAKYEKSIVEQIPVKKKSKFDSDKNLVYAAAICIIVLVSLHLFNRHDAHLTDQELITQLQGEISAEDLATRLMRKEDDFLIMDLRSQQQYDVYHIPGARFLTQDVKFDEISSVVIYSQFGNINLEIINSLKEMTALPVYFLKGGLSSWVTNVLYPDLTNLPSTDKRLINRKAIMSKFFGGYPKTSHFRETDIVKKYKREGC